MDKIQGRTIKSLRNAKVALILYFVNLILTFFSRKIFIDYLGAEVLGLNTTATNILGFLNLAELGIGVAIAYSLYKPIHEDNHLTINEIVAVEGYWYRRIAFIVIACALVIMAFFPLIFEKAELPLWYTYVTFLVLLCSSMFGYLWNYKQIVLTADQKEYKVTLNRQGLTALKVVFQVLSIRYFSNGYIWWLIWEFVFAVVITVSINYIIHKSYPWLNVDIKKGKILQEKYPAIITKTKQLFVHKIGDYLTKQTSSIIIYAFTSLTIVAVYGNYWLIAMGILSLFAAMFNGIDAGIGNLVATSRKEHVMSVFWELFSVRFYLAALTCYGIFKLVTPLMKLWIGTDYLLDNESLLLMIGILYIYLTATIVESFINAYGLYHDIWAPITESVINITLSIILGSIYGLPGILSGILIGLIIIRMCWKPYFLFREGFQRAVVRYFLRYAKLFILMSGVIYLADVVINQIPISPEDSMVAFGIYAFCVIGVAGSFATITFLVLDDGLRCFCSRFIVIKKILHL